jgi:hypothetical protein
MDWSFAAEPPSVLGGADTRILFANDRFGVWNVWSSSPTLLSSADGLRWAVTELPWPVLDIAAGHGMFVAVGEGALLRSTDGQAWTQVGAALETPLTAIDFGDGVFLTVVGYDQEQRELYLLSSEDGLEWTAQTVAHADWVEATSPLHYLSGAFVSGNLRLQRQGHTWQTERTGLPVPRDVASGNGLHVGLGWPGARVSGDGRNWAELSVSLHELVSGNGRLVAAGGNTHKETTGGMFSSEKGLTWTPGAVSPSAEVRSLTYGAGRFLATTAYGDMQTSIDGQSWAKQPSPFGPNHSPPAGVAFGGARFVTLGDGGDGRLLSAVSGDGVNWTVGEPQLRLDSCFTSRSLAYGNGRFIAITGSGTVVSSDDGLLWARSGLVEADRLILAGEQFLAWHSTGGAQVWTSPDGAHWSGHSLNTDYAISDIAYGGGFYVGIVPPGDPSPVLVSRDLKNWRTYSAPVSAILRGSVFSNGRFYLLGDNSTIVRSNPIIHLLPPQLTDAGARLVFTGETGREYEIQTSHDLRRWERLATVTATQERIEYLDRAAANLLLRSYRVLMRDTP